MNPYNSMTNSEKLKKMLESKSIVKVGGAYDALSAKLVETSGFDAIWAGSFAISLRKWILLHLYFWYNSK